jgi:hypothetical protein
VTDEAADTAWARRLDAALTVEPTVETVPPTGEDRRDQLPPPPGDGPERDRPAPRAWGEGTTATGVGGGTVTVIDGRRRCRGAGELGHRGGACGASRPCVCLARHRMPSIAG